MGRPTTGEGLSKLHADLGELRGMVKTMLETTEREHREARENRRLVFDKLDAVEDRMVSVEHKVEPLIETVGKHGEAIGELQVLKTHFGVVVAIGGAVVSMVVAGLGWLASHFWDQIRAGLRWLLG